MKKITFVFSALPLLYAFLVTGCKKDDGYHKDAGKPSIVIRSSDAALAFPGAEGFGQKITGGRTGMIWKVTNLNDGGTGSLREAVEAKGPRIVMFNISGTISLESPLKITNDSITIAGQTAPGDGITLKKYPVSIAANNVIVRYLRFRMGDEAVAAGDAISGYDKKNIIIDHCSVSWSTDELASFYNNENFTLQWSIISESLHNTKGGGVHGYGGIWGGKNASFHHNLIAHNNSRNTRFGERAGTNFALTDLVDFRNNVIYNWGDNSVHGGEAMNINLVNNYYKPGPATPVSMAARIFAIDKNLTAATPTYNKWGKYYITGNVVDGHPDATTDNWAYGVYNQFHSNYGTVPDSNKTGMKQTTAFAISNNVTTHDAAVAYERVLTYAGAVLTRDAVDVRVVDNVRNGNFSKPGSNGSTNGIIDSHTDADGWPSLKTANAPKDTDNDGMPDDWEVSRGLDPNYPNGHSRNLSNVYDNVEVYINSLVSDITASQVK